MNDLATIKPRMAIDLVPASVLAQAQELSAAAMQLRAFGSHAYRPGMEAERAAAVCASALQTGTHRAILSEIEDARQPATRKQIVDQVTILLASNPRPLVDAQIYARMLVEDIAAANPSKLALFEALKRLRRESEFLPTICRSLEELAAQEGRFALTARNLRELPNYLCEAQAELEVAAEQFARRVTEFERRRDERERIVADICADYERFQTDAEGTTIDYQLKRDIETFQDGGVAAFRVHYDRSRSHPEGWR